MTSAGSEPGASASHEAETRDLRSDLPGTLIEAVELLRSVHKKVTRLEKALQESQEESAKVRAELKDLKRVVVRKKHLKRIKKVLDQLEVVELADDPSSRNHPV